MKLYNLKETSEKDVFRIVDVDGNWTHYQTPKGIKPGVTHILHKASAKDEGFYQYLLSTNKDEAQKKLETAGDEGARVHDAIKDLILGQEISINSLYPSEQTGKPEPLNMKEWEALLAWQRFTERFQPETIAVEHTVYDDKVAGTIDYIATILLTAGEKIYLNDKEVTIKSTTRIKALLDWKKSGNIYPEYKKQTGVYRQIYGDKTVTHTCIVRLGTKHKSGYEIRLYDAAFSDKHAKLFWNDYDYYSYQNPKPWEPDETEIPEKIKVSIPKYTEPETPVKKKNVTK